MSVERVIFVAFQLKLLFSVFYLGRHIRQSVEHIQTTREYFQPVRKHVRLKEAVLCLNITFWVQFLREKRPFKNRSPKYNAASSIKAGELLRDYTIRAHHIDPISREVQKISKLISSTMEKEYNRSASLLPILNHWK
jgi:hypothetical protein